MKQPPWNKLQSPLGHTPSAIPTVSINKKDITPFRHRLFKIYARVGFLDSYKMFGGMWRGVAVQEHVAAVSYSSPLFTCGSQTVPINQMMDSLFRSRSAFVVSNAPLQAWAVKDL